MVYIVIVNWNGWRHTIECLESLLRLNADDFSVIVCDNGSTDGSIEKLKQWATGEIEASREGAPWKLLPDVRRRQPELMIAERCAKRAGERLITVVRVGENLGFAGANNIGIKLALADASTDFIWLLNNDTQVDPEALTALRRRVAEDAGIGMCGATLIYSDTAQTIQSLGVHHDYLTGRGTHLGFGISRDELPPREQIEAEMTYVVGASMLVSRRFIETVGLMSEEYFLYYEELDWAFRSSGKFHLAWAPDAIVYHKEGSSIGTDMKSRYSAVGTYYASVNALRFAWRCRPMLLPCAFTRLVYIALRFVVRGKPGAARVIAIAAGDFIAGRKRRGGELRF
jgi:GT2 family glycosyltransferase